MIEVKRGSEDISATAVRKALRDNDEATYSKLVPDTWKKQFTFLREIIMDVNEDDVGNQNRYGTQGVRPMKSLYEYLMNV